MKLGAKGSLVMSLQQLLCAHGFPCETDGWFDQETKAAVIAFQKANGLIPYGVVGPRTNACLNGQRDPRWLTPGAVEAAAKTLDVPVAALLAVIDVESDGTGFVDGKISILFERHHFHRLVSEKSPERAAQIQQMIPGICSPNRGGYAGGVAEHVRFSAAYEFEPDAAICATSFGMFQVMGFHWQLVGCKSPADFYQQMLSGEDAQLDILVRFIQSQPGMQKALKARKWADFARLYNGTAYRENKYDTKLQDAFEQFAEVYPCE